jgi:hypothetical protein
MSARYLKFKPQLIDALFNIKIVAASHLSHVYNKQFGISKSCLGRVCLSGLSYLRTSIHRPLLMLNNQTWLPYSPMYR